MHLLTATFRVVDFETTGLDPSKDKPCEVGWCDVAFVDGSWRAGESQSHLLDPEMPIPSVAKAVHHITNDLVKECPTPQEFLPRVFVEDRFFVAHNAGFDQGFAEAIVGKFAEPWLCTLRLAKHLMPTAPSYQNQVLRYELGLIDIPGDAHRAGHDVLVTANVLCHMLAMSKNPASTVKDVVDFAASPVYLTGKVGFGKHWDKTWQQLPWDYLSWMGRQGASDWDVDQWFTIQKLLRGNA